MVESDRRPGHVRLRDVQDCDLTLFFEHQQDPEATRMAAFPARERDVFMAHWDRIRADPTIVTQTILVDGEVAGNVVRWQESGHHEVGYWIGRNYWGCGVASEALALFVDRVRVRPLLAYVAQNNVGSMRVLEKCGFRRVAATDDSQVRTTEEGEVQHIAFVLEV